MCFSVCLLVAPFFWFLSYGLSGMASGKVATSFGYYGLYSIANRYNFVIKPTFATFKHVLKPGYKKRKEQVDTPGFQKFLSSLLSVCNWIYTWQAVVYNKAKMKDEICTIEYIHTLGNIKINNHD